MSRRRRRGHDEGGAHGGSWKIALADLMTVLMVFFLVMWLISIVEPEKRQTFVDSVLGLGADTTIIKKEESEPLKTAVIQTMQYQPPVTTEEIRDSLSEMSQKDVDIQETEKEIIITLHSDSFFESARASISDSSREELEKLAETMSNRGQQIIITGFTDNIPISNFQFPSNWELSAARAGTVARLFEYMGVNSSFLTVIGKGSNEAIAPNDTNYGRSLNRRVVIKINKTQGQNTEDSLR